MFSPPGSCAECLSAHCKSFSQTLVVNQDPISSFSAVPQDFQTSWELEEDLHDWTQISVWNPYWKQIKQMCIVKCNKVITDHTGLCLLTHRHSLNINVWFLKYSK